MTEMESRRNAPLYTDVAGAIEYAPYSGESQLQAVVSLVAKDLSEPYCVYTYRYFLHSWPQFCYIVTHNHFCAFIPQAMDAQKRDQVVDGIIGVVICRLEPHKSGTLRGYIGMLAVHDAYRHQGIGSTLVTRAIEAMKKAQADEVVLETEITNKGALRLYEQLGFVRDKRLCGYYLNGVDAFRLKLWLK